MIGHVLRPVPFHHMIVLNQIPEDETARREERPVKCRPSNSSYCDNKIEDNGLSNVTLAIPITITTRTAGNINCQTDTPADRMTTNS